MNAGRLSREELRAWLDRRPPPEPDERDWYEFFWQPQPEGVQ